MIQNDKLIGKEGWTITHDPLYIQCGGVNIQTVVSENQLKLIIYNVDTEEIEAWIN